MLTAAWKNLSLTLRRCSFKLYLCWVLPSSGQRTETLYGFVQTREMAACGLQFIGTPDGFVSSAVVPYDPESGQLDADSAVEHLSNKYCGAHTRDGMTLDVNKVDNPTARHCRISVESFLV